MRVMCNGAIHVVTAQRQKHGKDYFLLDNGKLIPADQCQPITGFAPGDIIQLVNPHCWEAEMWPDGVTAKVVAVDGSRLVISTPEGESLGCRYVVDAQNWRVVDPEAPPVRLFKNPPRRLSDEEVRILSEFLILSVTEGPDEVRENCRLLGQLPQPQKDQIWAAVPKDIRRKIREIVSSPPSGDKNAVHVRIAW